MNNKNLWFKNLQIYTFTEEFDFSISGVEAALREHTFKPCAKMLPLSTGWEAPIGDSDDAPLIHSVNGVYLLSLRIESKILPAAVIKEQLQKKVAEIEDAHSRKLSSKEKLQLRDDVYCSLLPQAFSKSEYINAMIDTNKKLLIIDASSKNKAEDFISFLRKTLDGLPVESVNVAEPSSLMTEWMRCGSLPKNFIFGRSCILKNVDEMGVVRCDKQDILSSEVKEFFKIGAQVKQLTLSWSERLEFTLCDDFSIKQVKYDDSVQDVPFYSEPCAAEQKLDASFFIVSQTVTEFVQELLTVFSGYKKGEING